MLSEEGQDTAVGVVVLEAEVAVEERGSDASVELAKDEESEATSVELAVAVWDEEETTEVTNFAPQIPGAFTAAPRLFLR